MSDVVGAGVRPDRAPDAARDRQPELEAGQAGLLGLRGRPRHRHARLGRVPVTLDARALGPILDDEAADAAVADDDVAAAPQERDAESRARARGGPGPGARRRCGPMANKSAGPPTRIVVNRASGSSRDVLTPMRRWISVPAASASNGRRRHGCGGGHAGSPRERRSIDGRVGQRPALGRGEDQVGDGGRGARSAEVAGRRGHRHVRGRIVERSRAASSSAAASKSASSTSRAAPASTSSSRVRALVAGGVWVRDDDHRQAQGGHLRERRGARPARRRGPPRRGRRASPRAGTGRAGSARVARPGAPRGAASAAAYPSSPVTCRTTTRSTSRGRRLGHRGVEPADGLRSAEDQQDRALRPGGRAARGRPRGRSSGRRGSASP